MSEHDLLPLDADVLALLEEAKPIPALDEDAKDALFAAIATRLPPIPDGGGDGGDGGGGGGGGGALSPGTGMIATSATRAAIALLGTFGIGIAVGVGMDRVSMPPPPPVITSSIAMTPPAVPPPAPSVSVDVAGVPVAALPSVRPIAAPHAEASAAPVVSARGLGAERALLDVARGALARGEANEALIAAERHGREYPDGALVEEREAIAIKALVALGRREEAQKRAIIFERRFPNGLMLRAVKSAVEPSP